MLRKLIKYEFKSTWRIFLPLYGALFAISIVHALLAGFPEWLPVGYSYGILIIELLLMTSIFVLTITQTIERFRSNFMQNEGYLMMTLPVSADSLILSKMVAAVVWAISSFLVVAMAVVLATMESNSFWGVVEYFVQDYPEIIGKTEFMHLLIEVFVFVIVTVVCSVVLLYACLSLGMLANKRRGLLAFGAFVAIMTAIQLIATIVFWVSSIVWKRYVLFDWTANLFDSVIMGEVEAVQFLVFAVIIIELALCAVFYLITRHMLKQRLNLQ